MGDLPPINQKYGVDSSDFKAGLTAMSRELKLLESEFKASVAGLDDWAKTSSGLEGQIASLTKKIEVQKDRVTVMRAEYEKLAAEFDLANSFRRSLTTESLTTEDTENTEEKNRKDGS